uniref:Uncharacterized protein n=2 Tax=Octactis speculum TaxID=3111310 RepID=A0A7S2DJE2_9STRA
MEKALKAADEERDDLLNLKGRQAALVDRQRQEKENRSRAEAATKNAIKKVVLLSQHVEKLMLHLKHEAVSKAKAQEAAGRAAQEVSLMRTRNKALNKRAASKDVMIRELSEGAKILEDQLRLMDEKYMEIRTKLDFTRTTSTREVAKHKQESSVLRAKWAQYSNSTTLLDDVGEEESGISMEKSEGWMTSPSNKTSSSKGGVLRSKKSKVRPRTQILAPTKLGVQTGQQQRPTSSMPALS